MRQGPTWVTLADAIYERLGYPNVAIPLVDPEHPNTLVLRVFGGA